MAQVRAENPEVSDADLMVQVSNRVKQAEAARRERAGERLNEFPYEMVGDQLAHRHGFAGPAVPLYAAGQDPQQYVFPFRHDQQYHHPFQPFFEEEAGHQGDVYAGPDERYLRHLQAHLEPFDFPWHFPPPHCYEFDRRLRIFCHPFKEIHFDPHTGEFYDYEFRVIYDGLTRRWTPMRRRTLYRYHRMNPNARL